MISGKNIKIEPQANGKIKISLIKQSLIRRHKYQYLWTSGKTQMDSSEWDLMSGNEGTALTLVHKSNINTIARHSHSASGVNNSTTLGENKNIIGSDRNYVYGIQAELRDYETEDGIESKWFVLGTPLESDIKANSVIENGATVTFASGSGLHNGEVKAHTHTVGIAVISGGVGGSTTVGPVTNQGGTDVDSNTPPNSITENYSAGVNAKLWQYKGESKWDTPREGEYRIVSNNFILQDFWNPQTDVYLQNGSLIIATSTNADSTTTGSVQTHFHRWTVRRTTNITPAGSAPISSSDQETSSTGGTYNRPFALIKELLVYGAPIQYLETENEI